MIGIFGLGLVVVVSVWQFASHGTGTTGVPPGQQLHYFAAPLAASTLNGAANTNPPCTSAHHDPRALNICLISQRTPLVLAFFVTGSSNCRQQVDALQAVSRRFPPDQVQFAAVAVGASHSKVAAEVRQHHWTIPVAYDSDGASAPCTASRSARWSSSPARRRGGRPPDRQSLAGSRRARRAGPRAGGAMSRIGEELELRRRRRVRRRASCAPSCPACGWTG